ncbi:MAG TPA: hypothetical protein VKV28_09890 [Candidatus Binataceae bacterium]|nr:hypothetical protein [Candidatus Binataceae bacterium]
MILPPLACRRTIDRHLTEFFQTQKISAFNRAISTFCRFYAVKRPKIEWYEYLDWGKTAGKTYENGLIHFIHPSNWKRGRVYNSERMWIQIVYHEMGHYLFWTDAERKADAFTRRMVHGLRPRSSRRLRAARVKRQAGRRRGERRATGGQRRAAAVQARSARKRASARCRRG